MGETGRGFDMNEIFPESKELEVRSSSDWPMVTLLIAFLGFFAYVLWLIFG